MHMRYMRLYTFGAGQTRRPPMQKQVIRHARVRVRVRVCVRVRVRLRVRVRVCEHVLVRVRVRARVDKLGLELTGSITHLDPPPHDLQYEPACSGSVPPGED